MTAFIKRLIRRWCPSPESERLLAALEAVQIDMDRRKAMQDPGGEPAGWLVAARQNIDRAQAHFVEEEYQIAWREIKAAERAMLEDPKDGAGAESKAATMRREAEGVGARRGKAMMDLLCDEKGALRANLRDDRTRLVEAATLRDDYYDTQYYRIEMRRRHLINLFFLLLIALCLLVGFSYAGRIELFDGHGGAKGNPDRLVTVILLGVLGAALSVAQTIVASDLNAKITAQRVGAFMVWMRPAIGATAAVVAYTLLLANDHVKVFNEAFTSDFAVVAVIALLAGFSERFIVGALNRVADTAGGDKPRPPGT
jgi:hypothetical protein